MRPTIGGEWCQARHVGYVISGRLGIDFSDGTHLELGPGDVFDVPPGHDGYTIGDEPCVQVEWSGIRAWAGFPTGIHSRVLATLLLTDLVGSTARAAELGDARWRQLLSEHFEAARAELERFGGREVATTGDGMLATFEGPARALHSAAAIRRRARSAGIQVRAGVHVGEVELVGQDVRGVTVTRRRASWRLPDLTRSSCPTLRVRSPARRGWPSRTRDARSRASTASGVLPRS